MIWDLDGLVPEQSSIHRSTLLRPLVRPVQESGVSRRSHVINLQGH